MRVWHGFLEHGLHIGGRGDYIAVEDNGWKGFAVWHGRDRGVVSGNGVATSFESGVIGVKEILGTFVTQLAGTVGRVIGMGCTLCSDLGEVIVCVRRSHSGMGALVLLGSLQNQATQQVRKKQNC